jgi:WD40 repeat protein
LAGLVARVAALRAAEADADQRAAANWATGRCTQRTVAIIGDWVRKLRFFESTLVCGTYAGDVHVIDIPTGAITRTLRGLTAEVTALEFDGTVVAAGAADGTVCRWDAASGDGGALGRHEGAAITAVALEGAGVVAACDAGVIRAHGCLSGATLLRAGLPVCCLQRAGHYTAAGLSDGRVVVWAGLGNAAAPGAAASASASKSVPQPRQILSFVAHAAPVLCLQLLRADGSAAGAADDAAAPLARLATGGGDGIVRTWNLQDGGAPLLRLAAHREAVTCLQADASKLVSGGRDGTLRVWDLASGRQRFSIAGHTAYLDALQFEGSRLIASGTNNLIALHDFSGAGGADDA